MSAKLGLFLRASALAGLVILLLFMFGFVGRQLVSAAPVQQGTPGYVEPPTDEPPNETETPPAGNASTETPTVETVPSTATIEPTIAETVTKGPDVFGTEDAEINDALTTPQFTETIAPTLTPFYTPTPTRTKTQLSARTPAAAKEKSGINPDWGMFWIGFSLPVLGACGVVLYLLDRRPDLFRRR